jgi:hypothetical protein
VESTIFWEVLPCNWASLRNILSQSSDRRVIQATIEQQAELILAPRLTIGAILSSETSVDFYRTTRTYVGKYSILNELLNIKTGGKDSYHCHTSNNIASPQYKIISTGVIL